jgi:anaerobic magnesium-protoporphyrin IX monomethyl ester cyclase
MNYLHILCPPVWEKLPSLGPAYLLSYLRNSGVNSFFIDINNIAFNLASSEMKKSWTINRVFTGNFLFEYFFNNHFGIFEKILNIIEKNKINFLGFSVFNTNRNFVIQTASFLKKNSSSIKIIFGGPEVFAFKLGGYKELELVDYLVVGEGELVLKKIITELPAQKIFEFEEQKEINFFPDFSDFNLDNYPRKNALPVIFGRGCINKCNFCSERLLYKYYRHKDENFFIDELLYYKEKFGIEWITFYDSMLNANIKSFEKVLDLMIERRLNLKWDAQIAIRNDMCDEIFFKMKEAGCINLFIGLESGSDNILSKMNKNFTTEIAKSFFKKLKGAKLHFEISLIIGYPDETEKDFRKTLSFIEENMELIPKIAQVSIFRNYPGITARKTTEYEEKESMKKLEFFVNFLENKKIPFTRSYINNLI